MDFNELRLECLSIDKLINELKAMYDESQARKMISSLEKEMASDGFWNNQENSNKVIQEVKELKEKLDKYLEIIDIYEQIKLILELEDESLLNESEELIKLINKKYDDFNSLLLLNNSYDKLNAIIELHPGAGGTEALDWCSMLYRMYTRFAADNNFKVSVLDYLAGDEAGIKQVTFLVSGLNAYGYLKGETGVHRLIRISPFDASKRRHTTFASVLVTPQVTEEVDIKIDEKDLKIDTYRSSGNGGQSVNTTDSAVRITHLPTKIVVTCQNERSQIQNREQAMNILKSKLYQLSYLAKKEEIDMLSGEKMANSFGSQIRSYIFHPYALVKDHRTLYEIGNAQSVLDGNLMPFMKEYLKFNS